MYTEKVRIYPNKSQRKIIDNILWECKNFYNYLLEADRTYYDLLGCSPIGGRKKFYETFRKKFGFKYAPAQVQQQVIRRLDKAFENFFNKKHSAYMKKIKFKSIHKFRSITYPQIGTNCRIDFPSKKIRFGKIGFIKANFSRELIGTPKTVTIKKMKSGVYYAFISVDETKTACSWMSPAPNKEVGIDVGVEKFLVTSDGKKIRRPRFTNRHFRNQLRRAQRKLSRAKKGSKNREKCRVKLAKLHERIANQRRDHHFKVAHWLVKTYETICAEDLVIRPMLSKMNRKGKLHRKLMSSVALGEFLTILKHMCQKYHRQYIGVNPAGTSQVCSRCGHLVKKTLDDRVHICPSCGLIVDRDLNSAWNILSLGLSGRYGTVGTTGTITLEEITVPGVVCK